jgi:hypothetical protein
MSLGNVVKTVMLAGSLPAHLREPAGEIIRALEGGGK